VSEAQRIPLVAGTEQTGVNFVLLPVRAVRVSGTVTDSNGAPSRAAMNLISAAQGEEGGLQLRNPAPVLPDGTFTILNVVPGDYILNVMGPGGGRGGSTVPPEVASLAITVGNEDLTGVTVVTTKGGSIRGTVVTDNNAKVATANIQVSVQSMRPMPGALQPRGQVSAAGTFELTGLVGSQVLRVDRLPEGWSLKSIRANGVDVTDKPLEFRGSELVSAQVVLTDRISEVSGTVRVKNQIATDASVVLFPEDPSQWAFPSRRVRMARVDQNGVFRLRGVPAASRYLAVAVDYLEQGEFQNPEFLEKMRPNAIAFALTDGENKNIDLMLVER
jgi:hypothetical protein